jgi:hypothetical protein
MTYSRTQFKSNYGEDFLHIFYPEESSIHLPLSSTNIQPVVSSKLVEYQIKKVLFVVLFVVQLKTFTGLAEWLVITGLLLVGVLRPSASARPWEVVVLA